MRALQEQLTHGGDAVGSTEEEKQQLSPVSVMDFPFHDGDDDETSDAGTCSPATSFQHCLPDDPERALRKPSLLLRQFNYYCSG